MLPGVQQPNKRGDPDLQKWNKHKLLLCLRGRMPVYECMHFGNLCSIWLPTEKIHCIWFPKENQQKRDDHWKMKAETLGKLESYFPQNNFCSFFNQSSISFSYHLFSFLSCKKKKSKIIKSWCFGVVFFFVLPFLFGCFFK